MDWCLQRELWRSSGLRGHSSDINEDVASGVSEGLTEQWDISGKSLKDYQKPYENGECRVNGPQGRTPETTRGCSSSSEGSVRFFFFFLK
ncbi:hypothetical protein KUCAC02_001141 [Chaenocephalus aceratus]|uniref:Uncharacterized protein n=1 Tax=Chaenocephalus aceratus TaxID=36190 RepID=A0ACB9XVB4_CHAAC|nr:hypothetical protein KUCAC02_001141 [Chaenocephalus aceratus]